MNNLVQRLRNSDDLNDQQITFACVEAADEIERLRAEDAATIERCAQVVENFDLSLEYRVRDTIKAIAAAIRALKE